MFDAEHLLHKCKLVSVNGKKDRVVTDVVYDSRKVIPGCMFICITGNHFDGHDKVSEAVNHGASVILTEHEIMLDASFDVTEYRVENTREAMAQIASVYYGEPSKELNVIGITGTKGKTTTTYLIKSILEHAGHKVGLIGSIETIIGEEVIPSENTTPESWLLQQYFRRMVDKGCDSVVMEVSSQGLMMYRTEATDFDIGIFTNLEPDHIGPAEHASFEEYAACKSMLFRQCRLGIVNVDDEHCNLILKNHTCELMTYGLQKDANLYADQISLTREKDRLGVRFCCHGRVEEIFDISAPGSFSVYNALTAIAVCYHLSVAPCIMKEALQNARAKGRIELVNVSDDFTLLIDYAHNAMALSSLLKTLRQYQPDRLICLFGCGGNRSKQRRFEMGEVSGNLADFTIITSDNPRFEKPEDIIEDIKTGISKTSGRFITIPDRKMAIRYAIENGKKGDIIVLAGKGHEDYQEIEGVKYPMDERILIREILEEN